MMKTTQNLLSSGFGTGKIEACRRGIERIITACTNDGFSTPEFRVVLFSIHPSKNKLDKEN